MTTVLCIFHIHTFLTVSCYILWVIFVILQTDIEYWCRNMSINVKYCQHFTKKPCVTEDSVLELHCGSNMNTAFCCISFRACKYVCICLGVLPCIGQKCDEEVKYALCRKRKYIPCFNISSKTHSLHIYSLVYTGWCNVTWHTMLDMLCLVSSDFVPLCLTKQFFYLFVCYDCAKSSTEM